MIASAHDTDALCKGCLHLPCIVAGAVVRVSSAEQRFCSMKSLPATACQCGAGLLAHHAHCPAFAAAVFVRILQSHWNTYLILCCPCNFIRRHPLLS
jgi:hypothetical protein